MRRVQARRVQARNAQQRRRLRNSQAKACATCAKHEKARYSRINTFPKTRKYLTFPFLIQICSALLYPSASLSMSIILQNILQSIHWSFSPKKKKHITHLDIKEKTGNAWGWIGDNPGINC